MLERLEFNLGSMSNGDFGSKGIMMLLHKISLVHFFILIMLHREFLEVATRTQQGLMLHNLHLKLFKHVDTILFQVRYLLFLRCLQLC